MPRKTMEGLRLYAALSGSVAVLAGCAQEDTPRTPISYEAQASADACRVGPATLQYFTANGLQNAPERTPEGFDERIYGTNAYPRDNPERWSAVYEARLTDILDFVTRSEGTAIVSGCRSTVYVSSPSETYWAYGDIDGILPDQFEFIGQNDGQLCLAVTDENQTSIHLGRRYTGGPETIERSFPKRVTSQACLDLATRRSAFYVQIEGW